MMSRLRLAEGTFEIAMTPGPTELGGAVGRRDFTKSWQGDLEGTSAGVMLSCGDPQAGEAGYVAIEAFVGRLVGRQGGFAFQQFGSLHQGSQILHYEVVPGSGQDELNGISGTLALTIAPDGTHHYKLDYVV